MDQRNQQPPVKYPLFPVPSHMTLPAAAADELAGRVDARMFNVTATDAAARNSLLTGARVALQFTIEAEGRGAVSLPVLLDLEARAARALAKSLLELAERAEALPPESGCNQKATPANVPAV